MVFVKWRPIALMLVTDLPGDTMANDKKPKKAKPAVVHGASSRGSDLANKLADPVKKAAPTPGKKKK